MANSPVLVQNVPQVGRRTRSPQHSFQVQHRPYQIQPFLIAPVLPGDTLQNVLLQSRAVSDPIKNPLIGWWLEHYVFYVPHRAMYGSEQYQAMMLDPTADAGNREGADTKLYRFANSPDFVGQCLVACVEEFFRDQDEPYDAHMVDGIPAAQLNRENWLQSAMTTAAFDSANMVPDVDVDGPDANDTIQASEIEIAMRQYNLLRDMRLIDATYEDFLRTYGVKIPDKETVILPELIRYSREWTYPTNHIDPATGVPTSAVSWSVAERADKKRFFKEPGFIFGVTCARPKVYLGKQAGAAAGLLDNVLAWLPAVLGNDAFASLKRVDKDGPTPLVSQAGDYIVDLKDLYLYGDQFVNFPLDYSDRSIIAKPTANLDKKWADLADINALFVATSDPGRMIRQDGVVSLNILSRVVDTTAKT